MMAKKKPAKKKAKKSTKKRPASRAVKRKAAARKSASKPARGGRAKLSWLDEAAQTPIIERYARQLSSFIDAMADGVIETGELSAQEKRVVQLMKEVEPKLNEALHAKVTQLLCELTAYDIMQMLNAMQEHRPQTVFQG